VLERHSWRLYAHPLFLDQLERLLGIVDRAKRSDPQGWRGKADARLLAALRGLVLDRIPRDPLAPEFRQGNTLGPAHRHWFRARFGGNRFRLFFRADSRAKVIVYAWVNDRDTLRKAGAETDPYAVFARMLARGNPPADWPALLAAAQAPEAVQRFEAMDDKPG
jgi:toxin YhaV